MNSTPEPRYRFPDHRLYAIPGFLLYCIKIYVCTLVQVSWFPYLSLFLILKPSLIVCPIKIICLRIAWPGGVTH